MAEPVATSIPPGPLEALLVVAAYPVLMVSSSLLVRASFDYIRAENGDSLDGRRTAAGWVIGKAENVLVLTLVLLGAYTAIAVVFAAKGIVTRDTDEAYTLHILTGTLVNVTYSVVFGVVVRLGLLVL